MQTSDGGRALYNYDLKERPQFRKYFLPCLCGELLLIYG